MLLIFDIDGTLTQSETAHLSAFRLGLRDLGISVGEIRGEDYQHVTDSFVSRFLYEQIFEEECLPETVQTLEKLVYNYYIEHTTPQPLKGAKEFIASVRKAEIPHCFATGSFRSLAIDKLNGVGIPFDKQLLATASDGITREEIVTHAIDRAKNHYSREAFSKVISFGDGLWDVKTAKNLNLEFVGIGEKIELLRAEGTPQVFNNYEEIPEDYLLKTFGILK